MRSLRFIAVVGALAAGCTQSGLDDQVSIGELDRAYFDCNVAPVLIASCGTLACHGSAKRPFVVYGRARHRLERPMPWTVAAWEAELSADEERANYESAHAFALAGSESALLEKPLDARAGGQYHGAVGLLGPLDVFADTASESYAVMQRWIDGATLQAPCPEPEPEPQPGEPGPDPGGDPDPGPDGGDR